MDRPKYHIDIFWSDEDDGYIANVPDLWYCSAFGESYEEALREILVAMELHLETLEELGLPIPEPTPRTGTSSVSVGAQQYEDQYLQEAQDFFAQSMGRIKGQMQSYSAQLESIMQQLPEESQAQIQEMTDSYAQFEGVIDEAAQNAGVQESMDEAAQQTRQTGQVPELAIDQVVHDAGQAQEMAWNTGTDYPN